MIYVAGEDRCEFFVKHMVDAFFYDFVIFFMASSLMTVFGRDRERFGCISNQLGSGSL